MARCSSQPVQQADPDHRSGHNGVDGWDGYPAARQRLLQGGADQRLKGLGVLSGDVHAHVVADRKVDFDDASAPVLASEFCATAISSRGAPQRLLMPSCGTTRTSSTAAPTSTAICRCGSTAAA